MSIFSAEAVDMKKLLKWVFILGGIFAGLFIIALAAAAIIIPKKFPPEKLKAMATEQLTKTLHHKVSMQEVHFNVFKGLEIKKLKIADRAGWSEGNMVSADDISISYHLMPLLWKQISLGEIKLIKPVILVERRGLQNFNFSDMMEAASASVASETAAPQASTGEKKPESSASKAGAKDSGAGLSGFTITVGSFRVANGKAVYLDRMQAPDRRYELKDLDLMFKNISLTGGKITFSLSTPIDYEKIVYKLSLGGTCRYFMKSQSLKDIDIKGDVNGLGIEVKGKAEHLTENFTPDLEGKASLEMIKAVGLVPKSVKAIPEGLIMSGPFKTSFTLKGNVKEGLELAGTGDGTGTSLRYKDLFLKESSTPFTTEFKSVRGSDFFRVPALHAVFQDWEMDATLEYHENGAFAVSLKSKTLPLKGLSTAVPLLKKYTFSGDVGLDFASSGNVNNSKALKMNGSLVTKNVNVTSSNASNLLKDFNGTVSFAESSFKTQGFNFKLMDSPTSLDLNVSQLSYSSLSDFSSLNALINYHLKSGEINLDKLLAAMPGSEKAQPADGSAAPAAKAGKDEKTKTSEKPAKQATAPKTSQGFALSKGLKIQGDMAFKGFTYRKFKFQNATANTNLSGGLMKMTASVAGFGGQANGALNSDVSTKNWRYSYSLDLKGVSAQQLINDCVDSFVEKDQEEYKDTIFGTMNMDLKGTMSGNTGDAMAKSLTGEGPFTITGTKLKKFAVIKYMNDFFKDKSEEIAMDTIIGKLSIKDEIVSFTADTTGKVGKLHAVGGVDFDGIYKPDLKVQCDVKKAFLDSDSVKSKLPAAIRDKWDVNRMADDQGNIPVDFKFTGPAKKKPGLDCLDLSRLAKNITNSYTKEVQKKAEDAVKGAVKDLDLGGKLKNLFGK
jgi:uncharacterized protein involved in outer membrane biogenesis